jgi:deoxyribonuclease-4
MQLGAHVSISGGVFNAPQNGKDATCDVIQIFTKSSNQWRAKTLTDEDVEKFFEAQSETGVTVACAHDSYLINLASPDDELYRKSSAAFLIEMSRCNLLRIEAGLSRIIDSFNRLFELDADGEVTICLETTAGQGTNLGYRFEQLAQIIEGVENKGRLGICLDSCHIFAAGYPISTVKDYMATIRQFDDILGLDRLRIIHINDSKKDFGSKVDRHEHIGKGLIGKEPFGFFLNDKRLAKVPMILETPKESAKEDIVNLKALRSLIKK